MRALAAALLLALVAAGCQAQAAPAAAPAVEPAGMHFTITGPASVTFDWGGAGTLLKVQATGEAERVIEAGAPQPEPASSRAPIREAVVDGLVPGREYGYAVGPGGAFRAPPPPGTSGFVVAAVGDVGASDDYPAVTGVQRLIASATPAFVLVLGDLTYADIHTPASIDRHFDDVMAWSRAAAYMPVWGNHEWEGAPRDDLRNYKGRFALPHAQAALGAPAAGCCGEDWYWFDYGNARFVIYPEPYAAGTWRDWAARAEPLLRQAEDDPNLAFVVTVGHRPAYSSGHHGGDPALRRVLDRFGARFGKYVLNLSGHSHVYERTRPQSHVVHVTAGIGGGSLEHADTRCLWNDCKPPRWSALRAIHHGFARLTFGPAAIEIEAVCGPASPGDDEVRCAEGEVIDRATIHATRVATKP
jgi:hypothetical protein